MVPFYSSRIHFFGIFCITCESMSMSLDAAMASLATVVPSADTRRHPW